MKSSLRENSIAHRGEALYRFVKNGALHDTLKIDNFNYYMHLKTKASITIITGCMEDRVHSSDILL